MVMNLGKNCKNVQSYCSETREDNSKDAVPSIRYQGWILIKTTVTECREGHRVGGISVKGTGAGLKGK